MPLCLAIASKRGAFLVRLSHSAWMISIETRKAISVLAGLIGIARSLAILGTSSCMES